MTLRVYNSLTRTKEPFETVVPGRVGIYLCGPTVYKPAHIGHMVGPVIFDTIKRYLVYNGYDVCFVINITDIDDKLINRAAEEGTEVAELAERMTRDYLENLATIGVDGVDHFPKATDHIDEMQAMIGRLIGSGHAFELEGDVYFEVSTDDDYGKLSGRSVDETLAGTRVEANQRKRHPADFALWKKSRQGEPAWESPWGPGRPGWHIECSAMSIKLLGESLDIHGGGLDLLFPHHENELAQSESCTGQPFARFWLHNGLMQSGATTGKVGGEHDRHGDRPDDDSTIEAEFDQQVAGKLAGSAGAASVKELFAVHHPETVRFFLLGTQYRSPIELSDDQIAETARSSAARGDGVDACRSVRVRGLTRCCERLVRSPVLPAAALGGENDPHAVRRLRHRAWLIIGQEMRPLQHTLLWPCLPEKALGGRRPRQALQENKALWWR